ncbi:unnamed protein product [Spirodela intermedia]|uniref:Uncharacterized protein n=1 Tax=Spirodela intermedia TaxID=51605 RepID=A0A7I8LLY8_SPIIN|nr:unnamed protein product [Spirodela intermedia]
MELRGEEALSHFLKQKPEIELNSTLPLVNLFPSMHSPRPTVQSSAVQANLWDLKKMKKTKQSKDRLTP